MPYRSVFAILGLGTLLGCGAPGGGDAKNADSTAVHLPGVDTSSLTSAEHGAWSSLVTSMPAPCAALPLSIAECVEQGSPCQACSLAAQFLMRHLQRGESQSQTEESYRIRFGEEPTKKVDIGSAPTRGPQSASVTLVMWSDFQCPFCARAAQDIQPMLEAFPSQLRVAFKQYPLPSHPRSDLLARASVAAQAQNAFWTLHDRFFAEPSLPYDESMILGWARELGLDGERFRQDLASPETRKRIDKERKEAEALGLSGTPFIVINGRVFDPKNFDLSEDLQPWIQEEIAWVGQQPKETP